MCVPVLPGPHLSYCATDSSSVILISVLSVCVSNVLPGPHLSYCTTDSSSLILISVLSVCVSNVLPGPHLSYYATDSTSFILISALSVYVSNVLPGLQFWSGGVVISIHFICFIRVGEELISILQNLSICINESFKCRFLKHVRQKCI